LVYVAANLPPSHRPAPPVRPSQTQAPAGGQALTGVARIVDGDTVKIGRTRIRFFGIDAPERDQTCRDAHGVDWNCGQVATRALSARIDGKPIACQARDIDIYGRTVAVCYLGGTDLNGWMVENGWAIAYRHYSGDYIAVEEKAHAARIGIWSGTFDDPGDWRHRHRGGGSHAVTAF